MPLPPIKLFGARLMLEPVEEQLTGTIKAATNAAKVNELGKIVAVGDGWEKTPTGDLNQVDMKLAVGDIVMFQMPKAWIFACQVKLEGKLYMTLKYGDVIAKLSDHVITTDTVKVTGSWLLLTPFDDKNPGVIIVPESSDFKSKSLRYRVAQHGHLVTGIPVGQEVILDRGRMTALAIGADTFFYIDLANVIGLVN